MSAIESAGSFTVPPLTGTLDGLWKPITFPPMETIQITGGTRALQRLRVITSTKDGLISDVPVPSVLGSLILKAAAHQDDSRNRERHSADAAFLVSLVADGSAYTATCSRARNRSSSTTCCAR